jgi:hypothetical protein
VLLVEESQAGRELSRFDILELLRRSIDIILQVTRSNGFRLIRDISLLKESSGATATKPNQLSAA